MATSELVRGRACSWIRRLAMLTLAGMVGCGDDRGHGGSAGSTGGEPACSENLIEPPMASNPNFKGIIGGDGGTNYRRVAVGYVDEAANATTCCQDYAMAQMSGNQVRIRLGIDPKALGFEAQTTENVSMPGNAEDILLHDANGDNRNDLLALMPSGSIRIVRGTATTPYLDGATSDWSTSFAGHTGGLQMVIGELDCTAGLELAMPSRNTDRVVVLNIEAGALTFGFTIPTPAGSDPQTLAIANIDGDGDQDVLVAHGNAGFSILRNQCGGNFAAPEEYEAWWMSANSNGAGAPKPSPGMHIAAGPWCPGQPDGSAVILGWGSRVGVKCAKTDGSLPIEEEPHGVSDPDFGFLDYGFDLLPDNFGASTPPSVAGIALEQGDLFALRDGNSEFRRLWHLIPSKCAFQVDLTKVLIGELGSGGTIRDMATYRRGRNDVDWTGFAFAGAPGLGLVH